MFVVTHTPESCPSGDPEKAKKATGLLSQESHAKESKVKILATYIAPAEHALFFIHEADRYEPIIELLRPSMKIGTPGIVPVSSLGGRCETFKRRLAKGANQAKIFKVEAINLSARRNSSTPASVLPPSSHYAA